MAIFTVALALAVTLTLSFSPFTIAEDCGCPVEKCIYFEWKNEQSGADEKFVVRPFRQFWKGKRNVVFYDDATKKATFGEAGSHPQPEICSAKNKNLCQY
ncbi:MAG: hypothetical protein CMO41_06980 [Verrucomicrobiales bacterium]|nr:hypothetical protein [Verrucomicrobiales bacterium]